MDWVIVSLGFVGGCGTTAGSGAATTSSTGDGESTATAESAGSDSSATTESSVAATEGSETSASSPGTTDGSSSSGSEGSSTTGTVEPACEVPRGGERCASPSPFDGSGSCDPYSQDCPEGEKCNPYATDGGSWDSTSCVPLAPAPVQVGQPCQTQGATSSGLDDCDLGLMCWAVDAETLTGVCVELCGCGPEAPTCQGAGTTCTVANGGNLPVCVATCDPLADDCAEDFGCISVDTQFVCGPMRAAPAGPGEPCSSLNDCDDGLFCAEPPLVPGCTDTLCCTHFCDLDLGDTQCEIEGTSCLPWFEPGTAPQECLADLGLCVAT